MGRKDDEDGASTDKGLTVRPFAALKKLRSELPPRPRSASSAPPPSQSQPPPRLSDDEAFLQAMADVQPLDSPRRVPATSARPSPRVVDEAHAVDAYLRDLIDGVVPFDITDSDEYMEGIVQGLDRRILRRLRKGEFSWQAHIDLHGLNRDEARQAVGRFIKEAQRKGHRCVLIVHGRGLRSKDQLPVLKEKLKAWLTRGSLGTKVLAFSSARPYDGGTGALYVLLRR